MADSRFEKQDQTDNIAFSLAPAAIQAKLQLTVTMSRDEFNNYAHTVIDGAIKNYGEISGKKGKKDKTVAEKVWGTVAAIGAFGTTSRKDRVEQRVDEVLTAHPEYSDALLVLLQGDDNGKSLKSFRYMLAVNYLGSNAKTNDEAAEQIEIALKELDAYLKVKDNEWGRLLNSVEQKAGKK